MSKSLEKIRDIKSVINEFYHTRKCEGRLTDCARKSWLVFQQYCDDIKQDLERYNNAIAEQYDYSTCRCYDELLARCKHLEKENQELKVKADKYDSAQRIVLSTKGIDVIMKLQAEIEKLEKVIEWLKDTFEITLDSKVRISDGTDCIQAFPINLKTNEVLYQLLKEVLEDD